MATVQMSHVDLECGYGGRSINDSDSDDDSSVCFSDAEEGSSCSQFYSTADGDGDGSHDDDEILEALESQRVSSVAESDCSVGIQNKVLGTKLHLAMGKQERDCRICHLSLESSGCGPEPGIAIELGCSCKDDLAAAHMHCAEAWFKIKGNKICEICNSIARNVVGTNDIESGQQSNDTNSMATNTASEPVESMAETRRSCLDGRFLNFILACLVFAFVLSWLFHFNVHS